MKTVKSFVKVTAQCIKENKELEISVTNELIWEDDFSHITEARVATEILDSIEQQGYVIKEGSTPATKITEVPDFKQNFVESVSNAFGGITNKEETTDVALDSLISSGKETPKKEEPVAKKSKFRL